MRSSGLSMSTWRTRERSKPSPPYFVELLLGAVARLLAQIRHVGASLGVALESREADAVRDASVYHLLPVEAEGV